MSVYILAIESSCDDTSAAVIKDANVLSNIIAAQLQHAQYGGVVPEVASRAHIEWIMPVVKKALAAAEIKLADLSAVATTAHPGLLGSLHVGVTFAKSLALALNIPLISVNHMDAHIIANFIDDPKPRFPFLCLTVSGGHTQLSLVHSPYEIEIIGSTIDDAAGEAFDKIGKALGLAYPAGPEIDNIAKKGAARFSFPEPRIGPLDFSFSGLKTSVLYFLREQLNTNPHFISENLPDLCSSIQNRIATILLNKLVIAAEKTGIKQIALAGGVAANSALRDQLTALAIQKGWQTFIPALKYCTDNAAMIGMQGYFLFQKEIFAGQDLEASARVSLT